MGAHHVEPGLRTCAETECRFCCNFFYYAVTFPGLVRSPLVSFRFKKRGRTESCRLMPEMACAMIFSVGAPVRVESLVSWVLASHTDCLSQVFCPVHNIRQR